MSNRAKELKKPFSQIYPGEHPHHHERQVQAGGPGCCVQALGADRILFAGDYPWVTHEGFRRAGGENTDQRCRI